jgi:hypothetical protein
MAREILDFRRQRKVWRRLFLQPFALLAILAVPVLLFQHEMDRSKGSVVTVAVEGDAAQVPGLEDAAVLGARDPLLGRREQPEELDDEQRRETLGDAEAGAFGRPGRQIDGAESDRRGELGGQLGRAELRGRALLAVLGQAGGDGAAAQTGGGVGLECEQPERDRPAGRTVRGGRAGDDEADLGG